MAFPEKILLGEILYKKKQKEAVQRDLATIVNELKLQLITESKDASLKLYMTPDDLLATVRDFGPTEIYDKAGLIRIQIYGNKWPLEFFDKVEMIKRKYA
jgi:hypothetical protein